MCYFFFFVFSLKNLRIAELTLQCSCHLRYERAVISVLFDKKLINIENESLYIRLRS